jgi:transcriptional regulator with XRE-family HTH domain
MRFRARLAEERKRLGYKQAQFAALVGTAAPKQSLYENGHRALRAAYLARIAAAGVDILYVLTGERREGDWLGRRKKE